MQFVPEREIWRTTAFGNQINERLVLLGETEEYEPLSRAAYFTAMWQQNDSPENPSDLRPIHDEINKKKPVVSFTLKDIIPVLDARWQGDSDEIQIDNISIDSRSFQNGQRYVIFCTFRPK